MQRGRLAASQQVVQVLQGEPVVDDVLDDHYVFTLDTFARVLEEPDLTAGAVSVSVTRNGEEIDFHVEGGRQRPGQVGDQEQRTLQHSKQ